MKVRFKVDFDGHKAGEEVYVHGSHGCHLQSMGAADIVERDLETGPASTMAETVQSKIITKKLEKKTNVK